jgi:hypothetical protein
MRHSHTSHVTTQKALQERRNGGTLRGLAVALGYTEKQAATLGAVIKGHAGVITPEGENDLRLRLGLAPIQTISVPPCPDCGGVHTGRCQGKEVVQVVILSTNEVVRKVKPSRPQKWRDYPVQALRRAFLNRQPYQGGNNG